MLDELDHADEISAALDKLRQAITAKALKPIRMPSLRQHSPERELALGSVLAALRIASRYRLSDAEQRLNEVARDWILRQMQEERRLAEGKQ
jgi:hypothetical protein